MKRNYSKRKTYTITIDGKNIPNLVIAANQLSVKHITLFKKLSRYSIEENRDFEEIINGQNVVIKLY